MYNKQRDKHNDLIAHTLSDTIKHHQYIAFIMCSSYIQTFIFCRFSLTLLLTLQTGFFFWGIESMLWIQLCANVHEVDFYINTCIQHSNMNRTSYGQCFWVRAVKEIEKEKKEILIGLYEGSLLFTFICNESKGSLSHFLMICSSHYYVHVQLE